MPRDMPLMSKIARFVASPQGRRTIEQARRKLDTPENRQRVTDTISKFRNGRTGPASVDQPPKPPSQQP